MAAIQRRIKEMGPQLRALNRGCSFFFTSLLYTDDEEEGPPTFNAGASRTARPCPCPEKGFRPCPGKGFLPFTRNGPPNAHAASLGSSAMPNRFERRLLALGTTLSSRDPGR
jgi:hypothetical protein